MPEHGVECESFTIISINSLLAYETKYYLQVDIENCAYKTVHTQTVDSLGDNLFVSD